MSEIPGLMVFIGSGETSRSGQKIFDWLLRQLPSPVQVAILETPAGFELNSDRVAGRIGEFLSEHLPNYQPQVTIVPARKLGTPQSPDDPDIAALIPGSDVVFMGPGSPTYAVRQLDRTLTWQTLIACHRLGTSLVLASAAAIAASSRALPVYEIYKVGEDLHWRDGLDLLAPFGLSLVFVPHWNNRDGGKDLDTSRCYMGQDRFQALLQLLPPGTTVVGIDEKTALVLDLEQGTGRVLGKDGVTVLQAGTERRFGPETIFALAELGPFRRPDPATGLPPEVWQGVVQDLDQRSTSQELSPSPTVRSLVEQREAARSRRDWQAADALREQILDLGWRLHDTERGPRLEPAPERAG